MVLLLHRSSATDSYGLTTLFQPSGIKLRERLPNSLLRPKVNIPFTYKLIHDIIVEPDIISIGSVSLGETINEAIQIFSQKDEKLYCEIIKFPENGSLEIVQQGNPVILRTKLEPKQTGIWQDKIEIKINASSQEKVFGISCVGYVR